MTLLQHKDEVMFYHEEGNLTGTVILAQSGKVLIACSDDLKKLRFIPIGWYTGKHTYEDMIEHWGVSSTIDMLYEARIKPLNDTHLFKWFNEKEVLRLSDLSFTLEQILNDLEQEVK